MNQKIFFFYNKTKHFINRNPLKKVLYKVLKVKKSNNLYIVNCQESHIVTGMNQFFLIKKKKSKLTIKKNMKD